MTTIRDLPIEILEHIFWVGCESHPGPDGFYSQIARSNRFRHPFAVSVAPVCSLWHHLTDQKNHTYFTVLDLTYTEHSIDPYYDFILSLRKFRQGLAQSKGSNLFIRLLEEGISNPTTDNSNDTSTRLLFHAMHLLLEYETQLRYIFASLTTKEHIAYFALLLSHLKAAYALTWKVKFPARDWSTFTIPTSSTLYLDPNLGDLLLPQAIKVDFSLIVIAAGVHSCGSISDATSSIIFQRRQRYGFPHEAFIAVQQILSECPNLTHLGWQPIIDNFVIPMVSRPAFSSVRSISLLGLDPSGVSVTLNSLLLPRLSLVVSYEIEDGETGNVTLPHTVSIVRCICKFEFRMTAPFLFDGQPASEIKLTKIVGERYEFQWDMLLRSVPNRSSHHWRTYLECHSSTASQFLHRYKEKYRDTLANSPGGEWLKQVEELETYTEFHFRKLCNESQ